MLATAVACAVAPSAADDTHGPASGGEAGATEAWRTSPFHGVIDGATGAAIPCRCRFQGIGYRLGDTVCMNTHLGRQLTRCDLVLNNTSWIPTGVPCTTSALPQTFAAFATR